MTNSILFDEYTFYHQFITDISHCQKELIIESPFISSQRMSVLFPNLKNLIRRNVKVYILTRDPKEHSQTLTVQSEYEIQRFEQLGIQVYLVKGGHHRKLAIIDRKILWEGSLNILSQTRSREIMRRFDDTETVKDMLRFTKLDTII